MFRQQVRGQGRPPAGMLSDIAEAVPVKQDAIRRAIGRVATSAISQHLGQPSQCLGRFTLTELSAAEGDDDRAWVVGEQRLFGCVPRA